MKKFFTKIKAAVRKWLMKKLNATSLYQYNLVLNKFNEIVQKNTYLNNYNDALTAALKQAIVKKSSNFCDFCERDNLTCPYDCHRGSDFKFNLNWPEGE